MENKWGVMDLVEGSMNQKMTVVAGGLRAEAKL